MGDDIDNVINIDEAEERGQEDGFWGGYSKRLTPTMRTRGGSLGVNYVRVSSGHTTCPFHYHHLEDEAFFIISGRGVLRYGDRIRTLRSGDCVSCPAGTGMAHQIANPFDEDLIYLAIGPHNPHEVCVYPDTDKVMVRDLRRVGHFTSTDYLEGEPSKPKIFELGEGLGGEKSR